MRYLFNASAQGNSLALRKIVSIEDEHSTALARAVASIKSAAGGTASLLFCDALGQVHTEVPAAGEGETAGTVSILYTVTFAAGTGPGGSSPPQCNVLSRSLTVSGVTTDADMRAIEQATTYAGAEPVSIRPMQTVDQIIT